MKRCPHCHEQTFDLIDLLNLDYFSVRECAECEQPVRNDGLRQTLVVPAIVASMWAGMFITSFLPEVLRPFGFLLGIAMMFLPLVLLPKPVKVSPEVTRPLFPGNQKNDKIITVAGWNKEELRNILNGFIAENQSGWPLVKFEIFNEHDISYQLTFPEDIHPLLFASLVNYLNYPIEFGVANRSIIVAGQTTLDQYFEGIPKKLFGQKAVLYVPEKDEDHDVVYLQTEAKLSFASSFNEDRWQPVDEARLPFEVKHLRFGGGAKELT